MIDTQPQTIAPELVLRSLCHAVRGRLSRLYLRIELAALAEPQKTALLSELHAIDGLLGTHRELMQDVPRRPRQPVVLLDLITGLIEAWSDASHINLDASLAVQLQTWPEVLSAAIKPLLINALQHGKAPVRVHASAQGDELLLICEDAGGGFDPAQLDELSSPFRVPLGTHGGAGIGLALAQRMAAMLAGRVQARRGADGFQVCLMLPLR